MLKHTHVEELPKGQTYEIWFTEEGNEEYSYRVVVGRAWGMFRVKLEKYDKQSEVAVESVGDLGVS
jgi:hypothetical protein